MYFYFPERIYDIIKEIPKIKEYIEGVEARFEEIDCFREFIEAQSEEYSKIKPYFDEAEDYIKNYLLEKDKKYYIQYKINNGDYSIEEMNKMYYDINDESIDLENRFYLLSNIINLSYADHTYEPYLVNYIQLYETLIDEQKQELSKYIHLKYMFAKIYMNAKNTVPTESWQSDLVADNYQVYDKVLDFTNDVDITMNCFLEAIATSIFVVDNNANQFKRMDVLIYTNKIEELLQYTRFQYQDQCLGYIRFMDLVNMLFLGSSQYGNFYNQTAIICNYISNSFKDEKKLIRGLKVYDKVNMSMYAAMVRKYIRMIHEIPMLKDIEITNIPEKDLDYILGTVIGNIPIKSPNQLAIRHTVDAVDAWFDKPGNGILELAKEVCFVEGG